MARWGRRWRVAAWRVAVVVVALVSAGAGSAVLGATQQVVGPVDARLVLVPSLHGDTRVDVPPLGRLAMDTHDGPLQLRATVQGIRLDDARALLARGTTGDDVAARVEHDVRRALLVLSVRSALVALVVAALTCAGLFRRVRAVVLGAAAVAVAGGLAGGVAALTVDSRALAEPVFTGLLSRAPALTGDLVDVGDRFGAYQERVATLTGSVSRLYATLSGLPDAAAPGDDVRVLWVSDVHNNPEAYTLMRTLVRQFDVQGVVDTGDLTDFGSTAEDAQASAIGGLGVPYLFVRGNHDSSSTQDAVAALPNARVLDDGPGGGAVTQMAGLTWAGTGDPHHAPSSLVQDDAAATAALMTGAGERLAAAVDASPAPVDVALVHEPRMAAPLSGHVPLVLDGHLHRREHRSSGGTLELTQGSSGGAGLRTLTAASPLPLQMSVLHFDPGTRRLTAIDDVTVGGVGESSATVQRHTAASYTGSPDGAPSTAPTTAPSTATTTAPATAAATAVP